MKPAILTDSDDKRLAWLVDESRPAGHYEPTTGKRLVHYKTAVNLQNLRPGEYRLHVNPADMAAEVGFLAQPLSGWAACWDLGYVSPRPCTFAQIHPQNFTVNRFDMGQAGDLKRPAAVALLRLAAAFNNVTACELTEGFTFNPERIERPAGMPPDAVFLAWSPWAFHIAWHWSAWENKGRERGKKLSLLERFESLAACGYPHGPKAFERMHGALFPTREKKPTN